MPTPKATRRNDGELPDVYVIMRVEMSSEGKLTLRMLADEDKFFKDKSIDSSASLRKVIEENLENSAMYEHDTLIGTRVPK